MRTFPIEPQDDILSKRPDVVWMSPEVSIFGWGESLRIAAGFGPTRFARAETAFRDWVDAQGPSVDEGPGPVALASFTFDDRSAGSVLVVPEVAIVRNDHGWWAVESGARRFIDIVTSPPADGPPPDRPRYAGASIPDVHWMEAVADAIELIDEGAIEKVVLARDYALWSKTAFDPVRLLTRLGARFPECFVFQVDGLVGASPEQLILRRGRTVESRALAGSAPRSADPLEDEQIGKALLSSDKDRREHESAAASVGRVLGEICSRLEREPEPTLLRLANVQHLATRFSGRLGSELSAMQVAARLHPTAAVGGTPAPDAMQVIRRLERMDRGRYAGPVGWMDRHGDGCFAIALRCAEISGARARLFAGAGIVEGSLPESELEETRIKLLAMQSAFE